MMKGISERHDLLPRFQRRDDLKLNCKWCSQCHTKYQSAPSKAECCDYMDGACYAMCWLMLDAWHELCNDCKATSGD